MVRLISKYIIVALIFGLCLVSQASSEVPADFQEVLPSGASFEYIKTGDYYKAYDKEHKFSGVVFKSSAKGYLSNIEVLTGMLEDGTITAIKVLDQAETPGLGARVAQKEFTDKFRGKNYQDIGSVEAISGASTSSGAVTEVVAKRAKEIKSLLKGEK